MLSGNVAYYSGQSDNDMLHKRMSFFENTPIVLQNLQELAQVHYQAFSLTFSKKLKPEELRPKKLKDFLGQNLTIHAY